ncbi:spermidine/putrescine ABC transporter ATP-binding protein PotA [Oceanisphaera arctica]|uniref:Spermidine/putrescine import ATP-binding protein PotA n=1 Tax=Oceanisphaera arctica TaxID=641510 RepID=A0A2P5TQJ0_9GAMM|nr:spermidine/putrescine ABC transporter ATP-binding protein PotA [Oceanisphaera arctica]PPL18017.1 putrescine/spermidine ABC transporter ATP-binding protein [Oceanisphaera arctica]GHA09235.1 spermidine/putrescine import ATP-binding protein PotA [Oceanisphaera arctica]
MAEHTIPLVSLTGVSKTFDGKAIIDNLDLSIYDGEFLTILGPSGCGKTTVLRLLAGLEQADGGRITLADEDITRVAAEHRHVNTVFQSYALFPHMTLFDNVAFGLRMQKLPMAEIRPRVLEALKMVQLEQMANRYPHQLSGGQQQRVAIARAVVNRPRVLLLDESLSALDYKLRKQMQSELKQLQRRLGITFVFVTHDQEEALSMSDRIVVMHAGKIVQDGTPREIYESPANLFVARFIGEINIMDGELLARAEPAGAWHARVEGRECVVHSKHSFSAGDKVCVLLRPEDVRMKVSRSEGNEPQDTTTPQTLDSQTFDRQTMGVPGRIVERLYKGATLESRVALQSGQLILISEFFNEDDPDFDYRLGQQVDISWADSWEVVLPYEQH